MLTDVGLAGESGWEKQLRKSQEEQRATDGWQLVCACQPVDNDEERGDALSEVI
jgi:hypothetical protein